jgi:phenylalanine-4-hydroxylase
MPASDKIPDYLRKYCKKQDYARYTPREHSTWRYILRQAKDFFKDHSVSIYLEGLKKTGISLEKIPTIENMDKCLREFGWGVVGVSGFIPPSAFLDLQSRGIMPIAMDMRTLEHVGYTPAPDIVHEAAGHLPILADPNYREYLKQYANMAKKALQTKEDLQMYEAVRVLSDIKENPDTTPEAIEAAQTNLNRTVHEVKSVSEMNQVARMNWWTAEYGLVGDLKNPKIYGAGLLSSVAESRHCLSPKVKKIRLSIDCVHQAYDITEPQPQLFVAESLEQLPSILNELDRTLCYRVGGVSSVKKGKESGTVTTTVFENDFAVSGILEHFLSDEDRIQFIKWEGPVQLTYQESELPHQGRQRHPDGFSSPLGRWKKAPSQPAYLLNDDALNSLGLKKGQKCRLEFLSGFVIEGHLIHWLRSDQKLGILQWKEVTISRGSEVFYRPEWGDFDQIVGEAVKSVHAGPADLESYGDYELGKVSTSPGRQSPFSAQEQKVFAFYETLRKMRDEGQASVTELKKMSGQMLSQAPEEWLLPVEILEILNSSLSQAEGSRALKEHLTEKIIAFAKTSDEATQQLIKEGLRLADVKT